MKIHLNNPYGDRRRPRLKFNKRGRTKQSFTDEVNINNIIGRFTKTGELPPATRPPMYADASQIPSFEAMANAHAEISTLFEELPPAERELYSDPMAWFNHASDALRGSETSDLTEGLPEVPPPDREETTASEPDSEAAAQLPS